MRTYRKNGELAWMRTYASPIWDEQTNRVTGIYGAVQDITEQKLAQQLINESEMKFRKIAEGTKAILFSTNIRGQFTYANQAACDALGVSLEQLIGRFYLSFVSSEDRKKVHTYFLQQMKNNEETRSIDFRYITADGKIGWLSFLINLLYIDGKIAGFNGLAQDITERKKTEEALSKSELHFRSVWESSIDGMCLTDENGIIVSVNIAFAKLFEKEIEEIVGNPIDVVYGEDSGFNDVESFMRRFSERSIDPFMQRDITLWNGKPMSIELTNSFVETEGQPPLLLSIFNDVTERVKNERLLKESNEFNTSLIKSVPFEMDIVAEDGTILFQSDNLKKIVGYSVLGNKCWEVYSDIKEQCEQCPLKSEIIVGKTSSISKDNIMKGKTFEIFHTGIIFRGKKVLLETFMDISERKQAEREITAAREKAEEANKVKTNFLENMSHELRTPMIPILGFTELLAAMDLPDEVKSMAEMMNKSGQRLMDTLNIILDLAQVEKERLLIKPEQFNLLTVIDEVCELFQQIAKEKKLYLKKEFSIDSILITTDQRMLRHAINNLINNGLKFTQRGGVTLKASVERKGDKNFAIIEICDTGIGIPKGFLDVIWEEFRQASEGIGRSFEGNGLGLTITKNFIEKLNGRVWVESEVGKGSVFTVKLPADQALGKNEMIGSEKNENSITQPTVLPKPTVEVQSDKPLRKILYVEDEETSFSVVKYFLKNIVSIDWAKTGQEGVVMARGNKYQAILMDINLAKGIDGMQTTKLIRELPHYKNTPIIAITAYAMRGDKEEFLGAGCSHYIAKPFTKTALINLMEEVLTKID